ncbi:MAG: polysaccharide deacetylase family protein [Nocardioidaceae bacterium]|nr:polysaccharide deacetylase family protein [Nocardioidaceae bacterium]
MLTSEFDAPYAYSAITERPHRPFPGGARVAVWVGVNVEAYAFGQQALSVAPHGPFIPPDAMSYSWRDYGSRVGIFRMLEAMNAAGIRGSAITNAEVLHRYPPVVEAIRAAGWDWVAHGRNNSILQTSMDPDAERAYVAEVTATFTEVLGLAPRGWLGPARVATLATNQLLADAGYSYALEWNCDDQPFDFDLERGRLVSVPYSTEVNDIIAFVFRGSSGAEFRQLVLDHVGTLRAQGERWPSVLGLSVHPFLCGQPAKLPYLMEALAEVAAHPDVWMTTSDEIAAWYREEGR